MYVLPLGEYLQPLSLAVPELTQFHTFLSTQANHLDEKGRKLKKKVFHFVHPSRDRFYCKMNLIVDRELMLIKSKNLGPLKYVSDNVIAVLPIVTRLAYQRPWDNKVCVFWFFEGCFTIKTPNTSHYTETDFMSLTLPISCIDFWHISYCFGMASYRSRATSLQL